MQILVTGASGFIGNAILAKLTLNPTYKLRGALRRNTIDLPKNTEPILIGDLGINTDWTEAIREIDTIIHTAARVHVMNDDSNDPLTEFRSINVEGTLRLARQAVKAGVKRFIFISSIKVNGEDTLPNHPFNAHDKPAPSDPYGISKYEAEQELLHLAQNTGLEVVIIRPVLVYGPGVKANFLSMMRYLYKRVPLPLGAIDNQRSFVALDNLVDLIITCLHHPAAANEIFLVSDDEDLSTPQLLKRLGIAMGKSAYLFPFPTPLLRTMAKLVGKADIAERLCNSLQVNIKKTQTLLNWFPPFKIDYELQKTAQYFLAKLAR